MSEPWQYDRQEILHKIPCTPNDGCAYDNTCIAHRTVSDLLGALAAARESLADMVSIAHNEGWHLQPNASARWGAYYRAERALGREVPHEEPGR